MTHHSPHLAATAPATVVRAAIDYRAASHHMIHGRAPTGHELLAIIRQSAVATGTSFDFAIGAWLGRDNRAEISPVEAGELLPQLTPEETRQLSGLALPIKEAAFRLNRSEQTVKFHQRNIARKLGAANRCGAIVRAAQLGVELDYLRA